MANTALVAGVSGITGSNLAEKLLAEGWITYGLARNPNTGIPGVLPIAADLLDLHHLEAALQEVRPTHVNHS